MVDENSAKCANDRIKLYESLKYLEVRGGEPDIFRAYASELSNELTSLHIPAQRTLLN